MEEEPKPKPQFLVIKIPKPKNLERMFWICITVVLAVVAFYQPLAGSVSCGTDFITTSWFSSETVGQVVADEPVVEKEPEPVVEVVEEEKPKILSGLIDFKIVKVNKIKKSEDWGKILSVEYEIDNQKYDFYPLIRVYAFDESDGSEVKRQVKGEQESITPMMSGEIKKSTVTISDGSFDDLTLPKTVTLHLLDQSSEKLLKAVTTIITIT